MRRRVLEDAPMNQIQDRKALVDFLEDALAQADLAQTPKFIQEELDQELEQALLEYEKALTLEQPATVASQPTAAPKSVGTGDATLRLLTPREPWYRGLLDNARAVLGMTVPDYSKISAHPVETDLLTEEAPWYRDIFSQLHDLWRSRRISPTPITAQPVEIQELFHEYPLRSSSIVWSGLLHLLALGLLLYVPLRALQTFVPPQRIAPELTILITGKSHLHLPPKAEKSGGGGGGGGGRRDPRPASLGRLPRASDRQLTPPVPEIKNLNPVLAVEPTIVASDLSQLPVVNLPNYGDPFGVPGPPSSGPGTGGGIGTGVGGGVGPGRGPGVGPGEGGGIGGGVYRVGGGVSAPVVIFRVEPLYSEEARKVKHQGIVVLWAIVRKDGSLEILKLVRGLGLGLDESAINALKQWRFRPGMKDGVQVDVALNVEVSFTLR
jgi:periplasmic protein TonB